MENYVANENVNDTISQSYNEGIEKLSGTKNHILDFQIPKRLLEFREKIWSNLFDKYMEEISDEIELNFNTLEPEEDENEDEEGSSEDEYKRDRPLMRKPPVLIQYWIDTGNSPYNIILDKDKLSETDSSLSEKEPILNSLLSTVLNDNMSCMVNSCVKHNSNSSCSSVDTTVYILSNMNVTKKADTATIIQGAKRTDKSSRNRVEAAGDLSNMGTMKVHTPVYGNVNTPRNVSAEYVASEACSIQQTTNKRMLSNTMRSTSSESSNCKETSKTDILNANQRNIGVKNIDDIASIFQQFNKTTKQLNAKINSASENEMAKNDIPHNERNVSANNITKKIIENDMNLTLFHNRKKLYTRVNSPVDLMLTKKHSMNKIAKIKKVLHPALYPECTIKDTSSLVKKSRDKRSLSCKYKSDFKMDKNERKKKHSSVLNKNTRSTNNISNKIITNDGTQCSTIDSSNNLFDSPNNSDVSQNDVSLWDDNDATNNSTKNKTLMQNLASVNLNPVVVLERIVPFTTRLFDSAKNNDIMQKNNNTLDRHSDIEKRNICNVTDLDLNTIDSDESTIFIYQCHNDTLQYSDECVSCSIIQNNEISNAKKNDKKDKLSSLKDLKSADIAYSKRAVVVLERLSLSQYHLYKNRTYETEEPQGSNANDTLCTNQEEILDSTTYSNLHEVNRNKTNLRLPEVKIILHRLPTNWHIEKNSSVDDKNNSFDEKNISCNTNSHNNKKNKRKLSIPLCKNVKKSSVRTASKADSSFSLSTSDASFEHENKILDNRKSNSKRENRVNQVKRIKYSVLTESISSDEDSFVQLIQSTQKKFKTSTINDKKSKTKIIEKNSHDKTKLVDKNKNYSIENRDSVLHSSRKIVSKEINRPAKKKNEQNEIETKSSSSKSASDFITTDSLHTNESEIFSIVPSRIDNSNTVENLDKTKKRISFFNFSKNVDNDSKTRSNIITHRDKVDRENDINVVLFQTKTFDTDSSHSEESNSYTSNRKTATQINNFMRRSSRYNDGSNKKRSFNYSVRKEYNHKDLNSLNSSVANQMYDLTGSTLTRKTIKMGKRFSNEEFNDKSINLEINDPMKNIFVMNNVTDAFTQKKKDLYISENKNITRNKQIFKKSKSPIANQQEHTKILTFQTKSYYDSDSSESS